MLTQDETKHVIGCIASFAHLVDPKSIVMMLHVTPDIANSVDVIDIATKVLTCFTKNVKTAPSTITSAFRCIQMFMQKSISAYAD